MKGGRTIKLTDEGKLTTFRNVGERKNLDGSTTIIVQPREETEPLELGSFAKPKNKDVLRFRIEVSEDKENLGSFLNRVMGGGK